MMCSHIEVKSVKMANHSDRSKGIFTQN